MSKAPWFSVEEKEVYRITFRGFLAVELMEFDYGGKHYSYHGRKLYNAVDRLCAVGGPKKATAAELSVWGQAHPDWKELDAKQ